MRNIEKYNKYYGKNTRDPKKVIYFIIVVFLIITFIFGPLGGGQSNVPVIEDNQMNNPGNTPIITPLAQNKEKENNKIEEAKDKASNNNKLDEKKEGKEEKKESAQTKDSNNNKNEGEENNPKEENRPAVENKPKEDKSNIENKHK